MSLTLVVPMADTDSTLSVTSIMHCSCKFVCVSSLRGGIDSISAKNDANSSFIQHQLTHIWLCGMICLMQQTDGSDPYAGEANKKSPIVTYALIVGTHIIPFQKTQRNGNSIWQ
jgi:hypothetical protein